jgi:hypothetical protein
MCCESNQSYGFYAQFRKKGVLRMEKSTKEPNKPTNDSENKEDPSVGNGEKKDTGRRLQDTVILKDSNRKLNLERRVSSVERRTDSDPHYKGPTRRYTIDSRVKLKDRREKD